MIKPTEDKEAILTPDEISDTEADEVLDWVKKNNINSPRQVGDFLMSIERGVMLKNAILKAQIAKLERLGYLRK